VPYVENIIASINNGQTLQDTYYPLITVDQLWCIGIPTITKEYILGCTPCFMLKESESCDAFYLYDKNNYSVISGGVTIEGSPDNYILSLDTMFYNVDYKGTCDKYFKNILSSNALSQGLQTMIPASYGDGVYRVNIIVNMIAKNATTGELTYYTKTYSYEIEIKCCRDMACSLKDDVECKLAVISCKINEHEKIGRQTTALYYDMYRLLNILWLLENFTLDCVCLRQLKCAYDKIKNC